jgi:hypothetical protein
MLKIKCLALAVLVVFSSVSCTKVIYTTQQNLASYSTKDQVLERFGIPTEKREEGYVTEWIYYYGSVNISSQLTYAQVHANATASGNSVYGSAYGSQNTNTVSTNVARYVKFTFEGRGRVTKYEWQGVDLSTRKAAPGRTIACVLVGVAAIAAIVIAASSGGGDGD